LWTAEPAALAEHLGIFSTARHTTKESGRKYPSIQQESPVPKRIQLRRSKGWRMPPNTVKVDRTTRWGNPWKIGNRMYDEGCAAEPGDIPHWRTCRTAADCVKAFRNSVNWSPPTFENPDVIPTGDGGILEMWGGYDDNIHNNRSSIRRFLRGKNLACWCQIGQPCHADVLLEIANSTGTN
jgi:hypothetical protein